MLSQVGANSSMSVWSISRKVIADRTRMHWDSNGSHVLAVKDEVWVVWSLPEVPCSLGFVCLDKVSLFSPGFSGTQYVDQAGSKFIQNCLPLLGTFFFFFNLEYLAILGMVSKYKHGILVFHMHIIYKAQGQL